MTLSGCTKNRPSTPGWQRTIEWSCLCGGGVSSVTFLVAPERCHRIEEQRVPRGERESQSGNRWLGGDFFLLLRVSGDDRHVGFELAALPTVREVVRDMPLLPHRQDGIEYRVDSEVWLAPPQPGGRVVYAHDSHQAECRRMHTCFQFFAGAWLEDV